MKKKILSKPLFSYVEIQNAAYAKSFGKKVFGSQSAYINALIAKDRGARGVLGVWKTEGDRRAKTTSKNQEKRHF